MKNSFHIILLLFSNFSFAQQKIEEVLDSKINYVESFTKDDLKENQFLLASPFAKEELQTTDTFKFIRTLIIYKVQLVYTTFRESQQFDQRELNKQRLEGLQKLAPEIFKNDLIAWEQIAITGVHNSEEGKVMFHGFVFSFRPPFTKSTTKNEIEFLKNLLSDSTLSKKPDSTITIRTYKMPVYKKRMYDNIEMPQFEGGEVALNNYLKRTTKFPKEKLEIERAGDVLISCVIDKKGRPINVKLISGIIEDLNNVAIKEIENMPDWIPGKRNGRPASVQILLTVHFEPKPKSLSIDSIPKGAKLDYRPYGKFTETTVEYVDASESYAKFMNDQDSTVFKVMQRNKWSRILFIADLTGSMSPYTSQLLVWLKLNINKGLVRHYLFFNDGDNKSDASKIDGRVGGLYPVTSDDFNTITKTVYECMENGNGGDIPENNIEAAIEAIKLFPECDTIVMIADNFATPRDLKLLDKLHKPIKVILCGTYAGINLDYLNMIRKNHGSLHTIEEDIFNLTLLHDGEVVEINGNEYKLENGGFVRVRKL